MAASKDKAILFARATHGKDHHLWPVAVFNDVPAARIYAGFLKMAYAIGDQEVIKALDPAAVRDESGLAIPATRWSVKVVAYAPSTAMSDALDDDSTPAVT